MKRSKPMARGRGLRRRSAKQAALYKGSATQEGRAAFVARLLALRPVCEACPKIHDREPRPSVDVHEILARSAGGSILDEANAVCVCRQCHTWIGDFPNEATILGLRKSRFNRPRGKE